MRITQPMVRVMSVLREAHPRAGLNGYDMILMTGSQPKVVYRTLKRLEAQGWVSAEVGAYPHRGNAPRKAYRLTDEGRRQVSGLLGP